GAPGPGLLDERHQVDVGVGGVDAPEHDQLRADHLLGIIAGHDPDRRLPAGVRRRDADRAVASTSRGAPSGSTCRRASDTWSTWGAWVSRATATRWRPTRSGTSTKRGSRSAASPTTRPRPGGESTRLAGPSARAPARRMATELFAGAPEHAPQ